MKKRTWGVILSIFISFSANCPISKIIRLSSEKAIKKKKKHFKTKQV